MSGHDCENKKSHLGMDRVSGFSFNNPFWLLCIVGFFALLIRIYYLPHGIPIDLDGIEYFSYAAKISQTGQFPIIQNFVNNGWPTFLSVFFLIFHSGNFLDYMDLQRFVSVGLSVLTIIPVYLLCRRFFAPKYAFFGAILFAFDPKIITNSVLGITEPLYILLGITTLYLFFGENRKLVYFSFATVALFALIRYEGLLLIIPLSIMFFVRFRKEKKTPLRFFLALSIFVLILLPMAYIRIQTTGQDGLISHLLAGSNYVSEVVIMGTHDDDDPIPVEGQSKIAQFIFIGVDTLSKYLIWITIPNLVLFVTVGSYLIIKDKRYKNIDYKIITVILFSITLLIPAFYAYMRGIHEVRYLFIMLPILYLVSLYAIKRITNKFRKFGLIVILFTVGTFLVSLPFIENNRIDYKHEREAFLISEYIVKTPKVINADPIDGNYITTAQVVKKWPIISSPTEFDVTRIPTTSFNSLEEFIENSKNSGLTHIISDGSINRAPYLRDMFYHDSDYPYLIKEYDSADYNLRYHVKIYRIDYGVFEEYTNRLNK